MKYLQYIVFAGIVFFFSSCGENRIGEFYALIENRLWIEETMRSNYLWADDIPQIEDENDYFQEPASFFKRLLSKNAMNGKGDKYSYMEQFDVETSVQARSLTLDKTSTYGMEFILTNDPTRTTNHTFARILYVLPESPAEKAGIQRGDWISSINKARITSSNYKQLIQGENISISREQLIQTEEGLKWEAKDTLNIATSVQMEINPFYVNKLYEINGQKISYVVYNEFSTGPNNDGTESVYNEQMKQLFGQIKLQSPDAFILDLRYNNGGFLKCAQALGSLLIPSVAMGKDFINLTFNDQTEPQSIHYSFDSYYADANLNLNKIYIIVGEQTASASEAIINGLIPYLGVENVVLIGTRTEGKNVAMSSFTNEEYGITLWPVVAMVSNANNESNYNDGFEPQYLLDENNLSSWYPLGDPNEYLLRNTLSLITTGTMPDVTISNEEKVNVLHSSLSKKGIYIK